MIKASVVSALQKLKITWHLLYLSVKNIFQILCELQALFIPSFVCGITKSKLENYLIIPLFKYTN